MLLSVLGLSERVSLEQRMDIDIHSENLRTCRGLNKIDMLPS